MFDEQEHPEMFSEEAKSFIHDFLNAMGFTDELLDKLKSRNDTDSNDCASRAMKNTININDWIGNQLSEFLDSK